MTSQVGSHSFPSPFLEWKDEDTGVSVTQGHLLVISKALRQTISLDPHGIRQGARATSPLSDEEAEAGGW